MWNVNWNCRLNCWNCCIRINRNIVECKSSLHLSEGFHQFWINRNIVECKSDSKTIMHSRTNFELIETLWNVNYSSANSFAVVVLELIETLWNVNHVLSTQVLFPVLRINRNIVECKFEVRKGKIVQARRINRNIVECKLRTQRQLKRRMQRINRNIVECKYSNRSGWIVLRYELIETLWNVNKLVKKLKKYGKEN